MHQSTLILALHGNILRTALNIEERVAVLSVSLENISLSQASLHSAMQNTLHTTTQVKKSVDQLFNLHRSMSIFQTGNNIINWLKSADPSINHEAAINKHEPSTGQWFIESDAYSRWKEGAISSLWLHGIPGAGKTTAGLLLCLGS